MSHDKNWFRQHADAIAIIAVFGAGMIWMNSKFNALEKDVAIVKTVLVLKNIMPNDMAKTEKRE